MPAPLEQYKSLIDELAKRRDCVLSRWVRQQPAWPELPENKAINEFVGSLPEAHREVLAGMLQQARGGGIHDALACLEDKINLDGLRFVQDGHELPVQPFNMPLHYDWVCRTAGDPWPILPAAR